MMMFFCWVVIFNVKVDLLLVVGFVIKICLLEGILFRLIIVNGFYCVFVFKVLDFLILCIEFVLFF